MSKMSEAGKKGYEKARHILDEMRQEKSRKVREEYEANPKQCLNCGEVSPYEKRRNKFCSQSCAATYNNQGVVRVETVNSEICAHCGENKEKRHNKYCDACIEKGVYNYAHSLDEINSPDGIRSHLHRTREHRCEICGLDTWLDKPIALEVDHIDGNPDNNIEENLRFLCPNCHAQTDTYKGRAKLTGQIGRFSRRRIIRRKRYKEGKSW
jgi:hypothetical protein